MFENVNKISAIGTRGAVKGSEFKAIKDKNGKYVLNRKTSTPEKGNTTNKAINKIYVDTLTEAANLLSSNEYLINLVADSGVRSLREFKKVTIDAVI